MFINRCDDCMMVFVDTSQKDPAHSLLCCASGGNGFYGWVLLTDALQSLLKGLSLTVGQEHLGSQVGSRFVFWEVPQPNSGLSNKFMV